MSKKVLMQGNEAVVEGAIAAGMRFYAGYPITPSTEIAEQSSVRLPQVGGTFIQMEDEISSLAAVIGAAVTGAKAMTATSGPGFSLKQENIGYACITEIPCVIVDVQRSGPSTGLPTSPSQGDVMQARWGTHGDHPVIAISPASVSECYFLTVRCFNLSEKYRTPVILLMDEIVGHLREGVEIPDHLDIEVIDRRLHTDKGHMPYEADEKGVPGWHLCGIGRYNITGLSHDVSGFPTNSNEVTDKLVRRLMGKIQNNADDIIEVQEEYMDDAETVVLCYGGTTRAAMSAVIKAREEGYKVGMFRPITVWPFPEKRLKEISSRKNVKKIVVAEHNYGQIVLETERIVKNDCKIGFVGKVDGTVITPDEILEKIKEAD